MTNPTKHPNRYQRAIRQYTARQQVKRIIANQKRLTQEPENIVLNRILQAIKAEYIKFYR